MSTLSKTASPSLQDVERRYQEFKAKGLKLDMTRGKPSAEQLSLAAALFVNLGAGDFAASDGTDTRNYGGVDGLPEMKALFADLLETSPSQVIIGGNSSLQLMHDAIVRAVLHGVPDGTSPWNRLPKVKFLCPVPGYDRHFAITEHYGIEMIPVDLTDEGPDMDRVERLVAQDAAIKGMWTVPKYSNPTGVTYSDRIVARLAAMKTAAPDFRLIWDNAYAVHDLYAEGDRLANILALCEDAGHPNRPLVFASTSKVSFAGAGIAAMASSPANVADARKHIGIQTIGPDKVNQLRHTRFFKDADGVRAHMAKHAEILRPKFEAVTRIFDAALGGKGIATWTRPRGGYFVSLDTQDGCAAAVVKLADEAGVKLTNAGATYPYGKDPRDRNIRIAPSLPPLAQVEQAMHVVAACVELATLRRQ